MATTLVDFKTLAAGQQASAARILRQALASLSSGYQAPGEAEAELRRNDVDWLGYAALEDSQLVGWIGALRSYQHGWEIHPLVVAPAHQRPGSVPRCCSGSKPMPVAKASSPSSSAATMTMAARRCSAATCFPMC
jgi:hypothetical protein